MNALAVLHPRDTNDERWDAVTSRDRTADGRFVFAVTSTGVFCRPSCPSRRPLRERVRFFDSTREAEQAGFRACLRCRPNDFAGDPWVARVERACREIVLADEPPRLSALARRAGSSTYHFLRNFKRIVGLTPGAFARARRFESLKRALRSTGDVTTAMFDAGYGSSSRFYEGAAPRLAMKPAAYRAGGRGEVIRYATMPTPVGRVLVAATDRGVCSVSLGDTDVALVDELRTEYPSAALVSAPMEMRGAVRKVVDHLSGKLLRLDLPLDIRATAFQWQVWNALRAIPRGETRTYSQIAQEIGRPSAARAVARACASNPVALAVPCHRVVPAAGGIGGYRWGAGRKEKLLGREKGSRR
jgi:AraC family transcriptional regulator of adaptative response/methylated-DNA-[protein]-cysteine methyltransferase